MYRDARRKKKVIKPRFYVICVVILLIIGTGLYFIFRPERSEMVIPGSATFGLSSRSVVVRDETMYSADSEFGHILFRAYEGQELTTGMPVAQVYRWGYTEEIMQRLFNIEAEILELQEKHLFGIITPELDAINARIDSLLEKARLICSGKAQKTENLLAVETELKAAMKERKDLLSEIIKPAPDELVVLFNQESAAEETLSGWASDIISAGNGAVSFFFDGYELAINAEKLDLLTPTLIEQAVNERKFSALSGTKSNIYKLVDPNHWYIAFVTQKSDYMRLTQGESYHVNFTGYETTAYTGYAVQVKIVGDKVVNILEFNRPIGDFLSIRALEATIGGEFSGHQVESEAVKINGDTGEPYIVVKNGDTEKEVTVDVLAEQNGICIVRPHDPDELTDGMRYVFR